jgi:uncharacterized protein YjeT (DUF2065 family)
LPVAWFRLSLLRALPLLVIEVMNKVYPTLWHRLVRDVLTLSAQRFADAMQ